MSEMQNEEIQYGDILKEFEDKVNYLRGCLWNRRKETSDKRIKHPYDKRRFLGRLWKCPKHHAENWQT